MPAQGHLWSQKWQIGKEVTSGVGVPATRIVYVNPDGALSRERAQNEHRFAVGRRDNVLAYTNGPVSAGGTFTMPVSPEENAEILAMTVQGGVTPTTPTGAVAGRQWVFKPNNAVDSQTIEWDDGARVWEAVGVKGNNLTLSGAVGEMNTISCDLFATNVVASSLTGALSDRVPNFLEGWQTLVYVDAFGAVPGNRQIPSFLRNWSVTHGNQLGRLYLAGNTLAANRITQGELQVSASLTVDAFSAQALTEFNNWDAGTKRVVRLEFLGPVGEIEASINEAQTITITGAPTGGDIVVNILGTTVTIPYNSTSAAVKTAIDTALLVYGTDPAYTVTTSGGPLPGSAVTVTFSGPGLAGRDVGQMSLATNNLTGGTTPTANFATTTPGYYGGRRFMVDIPGAWTAVNLGGSNDGVRMYELTLASVYEPTTLAAMIAFTLQNSRTALY